MTQTQTFVALAALAGMLAAPVVAQKPNAAQAALKAAIDREVVDGDLKGAIALYEKTVAQAGADRATAAKALLRMAACHEKLGSGDSQKIYQRVVGEYADQHEAVLHARTKLTHLASSNAAHGDRVVWSGTDVKHVGGSVSPNGRMICYTDWYKTGNLMIRDLATGKDRALTGNQNWQGEGIAQGCTFSRDSQQVAYGWTNNRTRHSEVRIVDVEKKQQVRVVLKSEQISGISVADWSPRDQQLAVVLARPDRTAQIAVVSLPEGQLRTLKSMHWRAPAKAFYSPDGQYLAYDVPPTEIALQRDVFVMAVDGSQDVPAVAHPANDLVMGWSRDGSHLVFSSDRKESAGLWAVSVAKGRPNGSPRLLKPMMGPVLPLGVTEAGAFHLIKDTATNAIQVASFDSVSGKLLSDPIPQSYRASNFSWSPDGKSFSFVKEVDGLKVLNIGNFKTGEVRQLPPNVPYIASPHWCPDSTCLVSGARDMKGMTGLYRFDVKTGSVTKLANSSHVSRGVLSPDGKKLYYDYSDVNRRGLVEQDLETGSVRTIFEPAKNEKTGRYHLSPDGRMFATVLLGEPDSKLPAGFAASSLLLIPLGGGSPREIFKAKHPESIWAFANMTWMPDGKTFVATRMEGGKKELWSFSVSGDAPKRLDMDVSQWQFEGVQISPNGSKIAFVAGDFSEEIWSIDNLPWDWRAKK